MKPRVVYNGVTLNFTINQRAWRHGSRGVGDYGQVASGAAESYKLRREQLTRLRLRFYESEWAAVAAWIEWAQDNAGTPFTFRFDQSNAATEYTNVYLDAPKMGEEIDPQPDDQYLGARALDVTLRHASTRFTTQVVP